MPSNHLILCHSLLLLPSIFPGIRVFSSELILCIRWPKYWSFSFSPFNEYSELISLKMDWLDLLAVQGALKTLFQHHSSKSIYSSVLSFPYGPTLTPGASLVAQRLKHLPAMWETRVQSLGWEDPLEKEMATHSSTLAWKIPWTEEPGQLQSMRSQRVRHD